MADKKGDPVWIRLRQSNRERIAELVNKLSGPREKISQSEVIDWLITLGLDIYEFNQSHFGVFPVGLNLRTNGTEKETEDC